MPGIEQLAVKLDEAGWAVATVEAVTTGSFSVAGMAALRGGGRVFAKTDAGAVQQVEGGVVVASGVSLEDGHLSAVEHPSGDPLLVLHVLKGVIPAARPGKSARAVGQENGPEEAPDFLVVFGLDDEATEVDLAAVDYGRGLVPHGLEHVHEDSVGAVVVAGADEQPADVDHRLEGEFRRATRQWPVCVKEVELLPAQQVRHIMETAVAQHERRLVVGFGRGGDPVFGRFARCRACELPDLVDPVVEGAAVRPGAGYEREPLGQSGFEKLLAGSAHGALS